MRALGLALAVVVVSAAAAACKRDASGGDAPLSVDEACARLVALRDASASAIQKERCVAEYGAVPKNLRSCTDACVRKAKAVDEYTDCRDDCSGALLPSLYTCSKITTEDAPYRACLARHDALKTSAVDVYKCWSRCGVRAKDATEAAACDARCGVK